MVLRVSGNVDEMNMTNEKGFVFWGEFGEDASVDVVCVDTVIPEKKRQIKIKCEIRV